MVFQRVIFVPSWAAHPLRPGFAALALATLSCVGTATSTPGDSNGGATDGATADASVPDGGSPSVDGGSPLPSDGPFVNGPYSSDGVKMGAAHWSFVSGDKLNPSDAADFDDSFGLHAGALVGYRAYSNQGGRGGEYFQIQGGDVLTFSLATPVAGTYTFLTSIGEGSAVGVDTLIECFTAGSWVTLGTASNASGGWQETLYSFDLAVPPAQATTRFRMSTADGATKLVQWSFIKSKLPDNFSADPVDGVHPRLRFTEAGRLVLKARVQGTADPVLSSLFANLLTKAGQVDPTDPYWDTFKTFENHDAARGLLQTSLAFALTDDSNHAQKARDLMAKVSAWPIWTTDPGQSGALERGTVTAAFAIAYDTVYATLSAADRNAFGRRLAREAEYLEEISRIGAFWALDQRGNNWRGVIAGAYGLAGIALDHYLPAADLVRNADGKARGLVDTMFDPIGAYGEPVSYYAFALEHWVEFAEALKLNGGEDLFLYHASAFGKTVSWFQSELSPNGQRHGSFGDDDDRLNPFPPNILAILGAKYQSGPAQWMFGIAYPDSAALSAYVANAWQGQYLEQTVTYYQPSVAPTAPVFDPIVSNWVDEGLPGAFGFVTFRTGSDANAVSMMMRPTDSQSFHGHADQGAVLIDAYGQRLTDDCGKCGQYGDPDIDYYSNTSSHNALLVDGVGQWHEQNDYVPLGSTPRWARSGTASFVTRDVTTAYGYGGWNRVQYALRHALVVRTTASHGYLVLVDDAVKDTAVHTYDLRFATPAASTPNSVEVVGPGHYRQTAPGGVGLDIFAAEPANGVATVDHYAATNSLYAANSIRLQSSSPRGLFVNLLWPTSQALGVDAPNVTVVSAGPLSGFQVNGDTILFNSGAGTAQTGGGVTTDAEVLFVRDTGAAVEALVATQVTDVTVGAVPYLQASEPVSAVSLELSQNLVSGEVDLGRATDLGVRVKGTVLSVTWTGAGSPSFSQANGLANVTGISGRGVLTVATSG